MHEAVLPSGTLLRLVMTRCRCDARLLRSHAALAPLILDAVRRCEMTPVAQAGHDFAGGGHSLCVILAESHLAIHTYPERDTTAIVELSVCDHARPNRERALSLAHRLIDLFAPERHLLHASTLVPDGEWVEPRGD